MSPLLASIPSPESNTFNIGPLEVHFYGLFIAIGAMLAVFIARRRYAARGGAIEVADGAAFWALICGFLGARLAYVSTHLDRFDGRWWAILFIWEGGLALFGGLTGGALGAYFHLRKHGGDLPAFADAAAPALPLAQAIGRLGNYFNQELYGTPTTLPWALEIDPQNRVEPYQDSATFHPTFLYESLYNLVLVGVLLLLDRKRVFKPRGSLIFAYGIGYGFGRFLLELIRTDTTFRFLGLSRNAYVALAVMIGGAVLLYFYERRPARIDNRGESVEPDEAAGPEETVEPEDAQDERDEQHSTDDDKRSNAPVERG
ncbi:MAG: prolipoprotein diacylglyceryl transferase [Actinomycetota bacterium]